MSIDFSPITHHEVTPAILALFEITKPTMPRAFHVLEGLNRGEVLIDNLTSPKTAVVRDIVYGTLYFGSQVSPSLLASLVAHFREIGEVGIGCWPDDPLNAMLPQDVEYDGRTYFFTERVPAGEPQDLELPRGYRLLERDETILRQSFDYESALNAFGTLSNVLEHTRGIAILHGDRLICEATTGAPTHGWIEVGVSTAEAYRRQGFASVACARRIELCETQGFKTWWDCARQNTASVKLAKKLGYQGWPEYRYVWWSKKN